MPSSRGYDMNTITINFQNASLTSTMSSIIITNGSIGLSAYDALSVSGTVSFSSLYITTGAINFNVDSGTAFNASLVVPVSPNAGDPTLEITNFQGMVMVMWPTANGPQAQDLMSGDPITLTGYVG